MKVRSWLPITMFLAGLVLIAYSVATGEADVSLVVIIPVFSGSGGLFLLGIVLIILSFLVGFALVAASPEDSGSSPSREPTVSGDQQKRTRYGGVVLIGPIPIAFGSDKRTATIMLIIGIVLAVVLIGALIALA